MCSVVKGEKKDVKDHKWEDYADNHDACPGLTVITTCPLRQWVMDLERLFGWFEERYAELRNGWHDVVFEPMWDGSRTPAVWQSRFQSGRPNRHAGALLLKSQELEGIFSMQCYNVQLKQLLHPCMKWVHMTLRLKLN
ncbi:hypothetical protein Anapl_11610 [Anas platyrhynchos]|uniref:Uncharacterized protein n=1 Tax=Anas platyrhynchos TaxID=8839 RepID=R0JYX1_ANAPL|nr:hypothetical protein Anapl_11610 [Anas platyrhynchos]